MLGRVKKWLGIEGVKLELLPPEEIDETSGLLRGEIQFQSMNPQVVTGIKIVLVERFTRGRRKEKRTDEYELGQTNLMREIDIPANETVTVPFELEFEPALSEMDRWQRRNLVLGGLVTAAKFLRNVKSEYILVAEAKVKGVALSPFDRKIVTVKR